MATQSKDPKFNISGHIESVVGNFGGTQTISGPMVINLNSQLNHVNQQIGNLPNGKPDELQELSQLVEQLKDELKQAPADMAQQADIIVKRVTALVETLAEPTPEKNLVQVTGDSLKKAAENIAGVLPTVLAIATQIVSHAMTMIS